MGKVLLSLLLVGFLAGCAGFANRSQFAPAPLREADTVEAEPSAAEPEEEGSFLGGLFESDDSGGGLF